MQQLIGSQGSLPSQYTLQRLRDKPFWLSRVPTTEG
jgi:hypothetical protein